jgi:hypothetical protein
MSHHVSFILTISSLVVKVTKMGGHRWVDNNCKETDAGGGSTFSFSFPRGDIIHTENDCIVASTHTSMELKAQEGELFRVLLVDDSCKSCFGVGRRFYAFVYMYVKTTRLLYPHVALPIFINLRVLYRMLTQTRHEGVHSAWNNDPIISRQMKGRVNGHILGLVIDAKQRAKGVDQGE